jgi:hypothetical protein
MKLRMMMMMMMIVCLNAKSSEERVVYKRLNSTGTLIQRTTTEAPHE